MKISSPAANITSVRSPQAINEAKSAARTAEMVKSREKPAESAESSREKIANQVRAVVEDPTYKNGKARQQGDFSGQIKSMGISIRA